ncbi:alpha/beta hydrolase [Leptothermofonsia sp. ETS-13]|uniref:alpha/beta hydrolase n=1 Tax=Leptothermofonsia sp. ETS-13 TaxID=3035696 RepID=UPI003BA30AA5
MGFLRRSHLSLLGFVSAAGVLLQSTGTLAAERIVLKYGILRQSVSVNDLTNFAETGDRSALEGYGISEGESQRVRTALTQKVKMNPRWLDQGLNTPLGEALLDEIGQTIQAPADEASRQALRSALVLSASDDGKISLLEVIQKYPTREVYVDGKRLASAYNQIAKFEGQIRKVLGVIDWF